MRLIGIVTKALLMLGLASRVLAWDNVGHMQVADIAWAKLKPRAKHEITAILMQGDPRFRPVSDKEEDVREAFRKSATFPDVIKFTRDTQYEDIIPAMNDRFFVTAKPDPNNSEDVLCKTWHYYDTPIRDTGNHPAPESNALKALAYAREQMAQLETAPEPDRKMQCWWLDWIEHLVGDLHQPLHCVSSYEFLPEGDAGGNKLQVVVDPGQSNRKVRLHGYWDGGIGRAIGVDKDLNLSPSVEDVSQRWSGDRMLKPSRTAANNLDAASWVADGAHLADTVVYDHLQQNGPLPAGYADAQVRLCKQQAVLAGTRLANVLNSLLEKGARRR